MMKRTIYAVILTALILTAGGIATGQIGGFTDVPTDHTSAADIERAKAEGWMEGYTDEECRNRGLTPPCLGPDDPITVEQMAKVLKREFTGADEEQGMTRGEFTTFMAGGYDRLHPTTTTTTPAAATTTTPPATTTTTPSSTNPFPLGEVIEENAYTAADPPCSSWTTTESRQIVLLERNRWGDIYKLDGYQGGQCSGSTKRIVWDIAGYAVVSYIPYPDAARREVRIPFGGTIRLGQPSRYLDYETLDYVDQREVDARWAASTVQLVSHSWGSAVDPRFRILCREYETLNIWEYNEEC